MCLKYWKKASEEHSKCAIHYPIPIHGLTKLAGVWLKSATIIGN